MDDALFDALLLIAAMLGMSIVFTLVVAAPLAFWSSRADRQMPDVIRRQYGPFVQRGWARLGAVQDDHRAAYRAWRRYQLGTSGLYLVGPVLVMLLFQFFHRP